MRLTSGPPSGKLCQYFRNDNSGVTDEFVAEIDGPKSPKAAKVELKRMTSAASIKKGKSATDKTEEEVCRLIRGYHVLKQSVSQSVIFGARTLAVSNGIPRPSAGGLLQDLPMYGAKGICSQRHNHIDSLIFFTFSNLSFASSMS